MVRKELIGSYRDLDVYKMAMEGAIRIFELTRNFPAEERFSLVDQIRPPARSPRPGHIQTEGAPRGQSAPGLARSLRRVLVDCWAISQYECCVRLNESENR